MEEESVYNYNVEQFAHWTQLLHAAQERMEQADISDGLLIEVAAQHPLVEGMYPNVEFSARLDVAADRYRRERMNGYAVKVYVPGSRHMYNGVPDNISLSQAGSRYLENIGIPSCDIYGDEANRRFKGDSGVFNSSDECYVATCLFNEFGFGRIASYCSPAQLMRKALSYIQFGILPDMYSVPCEHMFHNYADEIFLHIPTLIEDGTGLQSDSEESIRLRNERMPSD